MIPIDLSGKIAVVTGGTSELGRAMVRTLAAAGADVAIHYFAAREKADTLLAEVKSLGRRGTIVQADIKSRDAIFAMRDTIARDLGTPHIIVNNAIAAFTWKPVLEADGADFTTCFDSTTLHNLYMTQAFVPAMLEAKSGRVISITTECAMQNFPNQAAYVAGKRGMDGMLRVLAKEVGHAGVTVNQIAPGWTISDRDRAKGTESQPDYDKHVPLKRRGSDQEIANAVLFFASELSSYITGCYLPVCGGNVMPGI